MIQADNIADDSCLPQCECLTCISHEMHGNGSQRLWQTVERKGVPRVVFREPVRTVAHHMWGRCQPQQHHHSLSLLDPSVPPVSERGPSADIRERQFWVHSYDYLK